MLLLALAAGGCGRPSAGDERDDSRTPPVPVATMSVGVAASAADLILPARVKAREELTLSARAAGRVTGLPVAEGASFRAGQTLAVFAAPEAREAAQAARSAVAAAQARLASAATQNGRIEALLARRVVAVRDAEVSRAELRAAEADLGTAQASARRVAAETAVQAPFDGVMVRHRVDAGAEVGMGQALVDVRSSGAGAELVVAVPESELPRAGAPRLEYQLAGGPWLAARVDRWEGMTDPATRTRTAYVRPAAAAALDPGAFARVRFVPSLASGGGIDPSSGLSGTSDPASRLRTASSGPVAATADPGAGDPPLSYRVPAASLVRRGGLTGVFVVRDGRASLRWLRLGREDGDQVEILAGLWPGEQVALSPGGLVDGRPVRVQR